MEDLRRTRARAALDFLPVERMPDWAAESLATGWDSPSLRELAGLDQDDPRGIRDTFTAALDELGVPALSEAQARWEMARAWAQAAIKGTMTPYEAARFIWREAANPLDVPDALNLFIGLASGWEEEPRHRTAHDAEIIETALASLASSPSYRTTSERPD